MKGGGVNQPRGSNLSVIWPIKPTLVKIKGDLHENETPDKTRFGIETNWFSRAKILRTDIYLCMVAAKCLSSESF